jgi:hypothetical protein
MRPVGGTLFRWWLFWTALAGLAVLYVGTRYGWSAPAARLAEVGGGLFSFYVAGRCARSWWSTAEYGLLHWWHRS